MGLEGPNLSRRKFLLGGAALGAAAAAGIALKNRGTEQVRTESAPAKPEAAPERHPSFLEYQSLPKEYATGELEGMKFADLLAKYTGIEGKVPEMAQIDFKYQLKTMLMEKLKLMEGRGEDTAEMRDVAAKLFDSYDPAAAHRMNLDEYESSIKKALSEVRVHDVSQIARLRAFSDFDDAQIELLKRFEARIDEKVLLAYQATEILPTSGEHSAAGLAVLEFLLQNAGTEYIDRLPALHDSLVSFGPYQFTKYALEDGGRMKTGASLINSILPHSQIPAHVSGLRGAEHHKAAYLFALFNAAQLIDRLDAEGSAKLLKHFDSVPQDAILEYVATAHHLPGNAIKAFDGYAAAYVRFKEYQGAAHSHHAHRISHHAPHAKEPHFSDFCATHGIGTYCEKTKANSSALDMRK